MTKNCSRWIIQHLICWFVPISFPTWRLRRRRRGKSACASRTKKVRRPEVQDVPLRRKKSCWGAEATQADGLKGLRTALTAQDILLTRENGLSDDIQLSSESSQIVFASVHRVPNSKCSPFSYYQVSRRRYPQNRQRSCFGKFVFFPLTICLSRSDSNELFLPLEYQKWTGVVFTLFISYCSNFI